MKKQLLAIAVSAATVAPMSAMAQDNAEGPSVYGRWDVTLQKSESVDANGNSDRTAPNPGGNNPHPIVSNNRYTGNNNTNVGDHWELRNNTSWLGVKGGADLDQQLKAMYQLEMAFSPGLDSGGTPNFGLRNTYAGIGSEAWGKVFVGRYDSIIKQAEFSVDQFNYTDADMTVFMGTRGQTRYDDTLNYHSPKFGPSLQVKLQLRPGESRTDNDAGSQPSSEDGPADGMGISLGFEEGNMYGAIAYETNQNKISGGGTGNSDLQITRVTGGLDDKMFGVGFLYEQHDSSDAADAFGSNNDDARAGWLLSGRYNVTEPLALKLQYGDSETRVPGHGGANNNDGGMTSTTLGADYSLGKQTKVYGYYSMNTDETQNSDAEFNVLALGMEHRF